MVKLFCGLVFFLIEIINMWLIFKGIPQPEFGACFRQHIQNVYQENSKNIFRIYPLSL